MVIVLICFISGLLLRLTFIEMFRKIIERILVKFIPGYQLHKSALQEKIGSNDIEDARQPVLITIDGVGQAGVIIEEINDGRKVVFIPAKLGTTEGHLNKILKHQGKGLAAILDRI